MLMERLMGKRSSHAALAIRLAETGHPGPIPGDPSRSMASTRSASRAIGARFARKAMVSSD